MQGYTERVLVDIVKKSYKIQCKSEQYVIGQYHKYILNRLILINLN